MGISSIGPGNAVVQPVDPAPAKPRESSSQDGDSDDTTVAPAQSTPAPNGGTTVDKTA